MGVDSVVRYGSKLSVLTPISILSGLMKNPNTQLRVSVIGTVIVALCCFTPILVILLGAVGLSAMTGYLDFVLLPALAILFGLTVCALWRKKKFDALNHGTNDKASAREPRS